MRLELSFHGLRDNLAKTLGRHRDVGVHERRASRRKRVFEISHVPGREVVDDDDPTTLVDQRVHQVAAEKTRAAGHQGEHVVVDPL